MKTRAFCSIAVVGVEMDCPLCGEHVESGEHHTCTKNEDEGRTKPEATPARKKKWKEA